jgi:hypothetical protein
VTEISGGGGGPFEPGAISASIAGRTLVISATVEIRVAGSTGNCAGSTPIDTVQRITLPDCEGEEIVGSSPRTYQFLCTHVGDWTWGIQGKVTLGV